MSKRGRPRKAGARSPKGRLIAVYERGNERVQARAGRFERCQGGKASQQVGDSIGRLWAAGLLDGTEFDAAILRDTGRRYGQLYWSVYAALAPKLGSAEPAHRGGDRGTDIDPTGERFARMDLAARRRGRDAYDAMRSLCADDWWFPDIDAPWITRLVDAALRRKDADGADLARLALAKLGLCALVDGPARGSVDIPMHRLTGTGG